MRAAVYLRISQDATGEQAGVTRQREDCLKLVADQGWEALDLYIDNDISASSGKARPQYRRLLEDIKAGQVDVVVAWHPDRLYRKLADLEGLIAAVEAQNVVMRTVRAGEIDLSTPTGRMLARILSATAQAEGEIKSDRWRRSWQQGREAGKHAPTSNRIYGYTRDMEPVPEEANLTREMVSFLLDGGGMMTLCRRLDAEEVRTTRGGVWTTQGLRQYLTNPRIAGWSTLKREIVAEGDWEPIVDRPSFEALKSLLEARTRPHVPRKALLNGLIHCHCEHRLISGHQRDKRTYRCPNRPTMRGCGSISINAEPVEEMVEGYARARLADPRVRERLALQRSQPADAQRELSELEVRVTELEQQLDQPGVPVSTILRAIDRARDRQASLLSVARPVPIVQMSAGEVVWPGDLRLRRALVDLVVARVVIMPARLRNRFDPERVNITPT